MRDKDLTLTDRVRLLENIFDTGSGDFQKQFSNEIEMQQAVMSQRATLQQNKREEAEKAVEYFKTQFPNRIGAKVAETVCPQPQTAFEDIIHRILLATDRVLSTTIQIEKIGARVMGSLPETDEMGNGTMAPGPDGTLDHTFQALDKLDQALSRLDSATLRLDRI